MKSIYFGYQIKSYIYLPGFQSPRYSPFTSLPLPYGDYNAHMLFLKWLWTKGPCIVMDWLDDEKEHNEKCSSERSTANNSGACL